MTEQRDQIVKRVMYALEEDQDPGVLVHSYFDDDRKAVLEAARQTLDATGEHPDDARLEEVVDRELIEALRLPERTQGGFLPTLYVQRGRLARGAGILLAVLAVLAVILL